MSFASFVVRLRLIAARNHSYPRRSPNCFVASYPSAGRPPSPSHPAPAVHTRRENSLAS